MNIFNGTPHPINIVQGAEFDTKLRKYVGGEVIRTIPSNESLNVQFGTTVSELDGIPVYTRNVVACDNLPEGYDVYIVSVLYGTAYTQLHGVTEGLYAPADPVMTPDGRTFVGCRGLQPIK